MTTQLSVHKNSSSNVLLLSDNNNDFLVLSNVIFPDDNDFLVQVQLFSKCCMYTMGDFLNLSLFACVTLNFSVFLRSMLCFFSFNGKICFVFAKLSQAA